MPWFSTWQFSGHLKMFFPRFFRGVSSMKHIETLTIWYRHRWIDLEPEFWHCGPDMGTGKMLNWKPLDMIWAVSIETGDSNGKMTQKMLWKYGFSWVCRFHHQDAVTWCHSWGEHQTPFGPTVRFSVIAGFVASSIGPDGLHHPVQSNCGLWGGLDRCAMISQMTKASFFFQDPKS